MGQPDGVACMGLVGKVCHHNHIVARTTVLPAVEGEDFFIVVGMEDVDVRTKEPMCGAIQIAAQANEVLVKL